MSDDRSKNGPPDASRININEGYELRYWREKFGVTADELVDAVQRAGTMAKDVEAELENRKQTWG